MVPASYEKLSEVLAQFEKGKWYAIYLKLKRLIQAGELAAVPSHEWVTIPRKNQPLKVPELLMGSRVQEMLADMENPSKKSKPNPLAVSLEDLESGKVDFEVAAEQYWESLQPKTKKRKKRSGKVVVKEPQSPAEG